MNFNMEIGSIDPALRAHVFELGYMRTNFFGEGYVTPYEGPRIQDYAGISGFVDGKMKGLCFFAIVLCSQRLLHHLRRTPGKSTREPH
jgi:hypothetical protein